MALLNEMANGTKWIALSLILVEYPEGGYIYVHPEYSRMKAGESRTRHDAEGSPHPSSTQTSQAIDMPLCIVCFAAPRTHLLLHMDGLSVYIMEQLLTIQTAIAVKAYFARR